MSSSFVIPPEPRRVLIQVYDHDSGGPRRSDIPVLQLRLAVCQTTRLRPIADAVARWSNRHSGTEWAVGRILDRYGDEFVDPAETVWGALELMPICIMKAPPPAEGLSAREETGPSDAARIAATQGKPKMQPLILQHSTKSRRESAEVLRRPSSSQGSLEHMQLRSEETQSRPATRRTVRQQATTAFDGSQGQAVASDISHNELSSSLPENKENVRHSEQKRMPLLLRTKGKSKSQADQLSSEYADAERERSRRKQEREYEATIDANLRRAKEEADRQSSASKMERAEKFRNSLSSLAAASPDRASSGPSDMDSSPTARVANKRRTSAQLPRSRLSLASAALPPGAMDSLQTDLETPSSPPVLGGSDTNQRGGHFNPEEYLEHDSDGLPVWKDVVDDLLDSSVSMSPSTPLQPAPEQHSPTSGGAQGFQVEHRAEQSTSQSGITGASVSQTAGGVSRPPWETGGRKRKRYAATRAAHDISRGDEDSPDRKARNTDLVSSSAKETRL